MNAENKKIWLHGELIDVSDGVYAAYMQGDRKMRYFEADLKVERIIHNKDGSVKEIIPSREDSLDRLMDNHAVQYPDEYQSVEEEVLRKISLQALYTALDKLSAEDCALIIALYFEGETERSYAAELGVSQPAVHKQKNKILKKLKLFLQN